jgi:hypothetical protein
VAEIIDKGDNPLDLERAAASGQVAPSFTPERRGHTLTRKGMEQVLADGGSVFCPHPTDPGRVVHVTRAADLPSAAALARGNSALEEQARKNLEAQMRNLGLQLASLGDGGGKEKAEPPPKQQPPDYDKLNPVELAQLAENGDKEATKRLEAARKDRTGK